MTAQSLQPNLELPDEWNLISGFVDDCNLRGYSPETIRSHRSNLRTIARYLDSQGFGLRAHITSNADYKGFINELKSGKTALLCMEQFAKPEGNQIYSCHRDILADMILEYEPKEKLLKFNNRIDL